MKKLWLMAVILLLGFLTWRWYFPPQAPSIAVTAASGQEGDEIKVLLDSMDRVAGFPPRESYQAIAERPLFFSKRRPPPPYVPAPPGKKPPVRPPRKVGKPRVQLSAVIIIGDQKYALIKGGRKKGSRRVRVGEEVDGWKVTGIDADKLVMTNGSETEELLLRNYKPVLPVKTPPKKPVRKKNVQTPKMPPKPAVQKR
jgi:general secretion pathway protein N